MNSGIQGLPAINDLVCDLEGVQEFLQRYGATDTSVRIGVLEGKFSLLTGSDAEENPSETGYWSDAILLTAGETPEKIREIAKELSAQVSDSYALQNSYWGQGSGVVAVRRDTLTQLRMAN